MRSLKRAGVWLATALLAGVVSARVLADTGQLVVHVDRPGVKISPMLYGLMTEEINHAYDGGIYGELIRNRAFKDGPANAPVAPHWSLALQGGGAGSLGLDTANPVNSTLPVSLRLTITGVSPGVSVGVANEGYWGVPIKPHTRYHASFYAKADSTFAGPLTVAIQTADGATTVAHAEVEKISGEWKHCSVELTTGNAEATAAGRFVISASHTGTVWLSLVSLFPPTYKNRPNGNRIDLMEKLGAMKPAFLRLPGGNYLEGNTIAERFEWKDTIHGIAERPGHQGPWGYRSTDGLGILEFLEWCEDLKMEPVLAVFAGYALNGEHVSAGPELTPYVDDALEEIEYATGSTSTKWGAVRAADGHPAPFKIRYVEIGNEDWFDRSGSYEGRFHQFFTAIKAKYPELQLIATGPVKQTKADVVDDHYYRSAADMARDAGHYDNYDRSGPKIFVGEWASTEGSPTPTLQAALGDAAWMTGMERNSDVVVISSYAPLLVNVNRGARQWGTNLIGYDALSSFGSPSYYVQALFGSNRGDVVLPTEVTPQAGVKPSTPPKPQGAIGVGTWLTHSEYKDIKVTHDGETFYSKDFATGDADWKLGQGSWHVEDGALQQTSDETDCRAIAGNANWTDYTYTLKARKISGAEGFLVLFHVQDNDSWIWWNIGGWGNTRTAMERSRHGAKAEIGRASNVTIETGKWYDIRVEVQGTRIRCYLDDRLVNQAVDAPTLPPSPLYATSSRDGNGDIILKVVNVGGTEQNLHVNLAGAEGVSSTAQLNLVAGKPEDVNTVAEPTKVATVRSTFPIPGTEFDHEFPPYSVSVIRIHEDSSK